MSTGNIRRLGLVPAVGSVFRLAELLPPVQAAPAEVTAQRFFEATLNIFPRASGSGFAGSIRFRAPLGEPTTVELFLSASTPVTCDDGSESEASRSVRVLETDVGESNEASLDMGRALRTVRGRALVDLELVEPPGCGAPETVISLTDQQVTMDLTGTSVLFHTGIGGGTTSGPNQGVDRSERFSHDGVGTAIVGSLLEDAPGEAFRVYGVDRSRRHGTPLPAPGPAAPPGGLGAQGAFTASFEPEGGLGLVFADALVFATASAVLELRRETIDGCRPDTEPVHDVVSVPVTLDLHATGPEVRVRDLDWHLVPGEGVSGTSDWYLEREATGTIPVGETAGAAELASIARAGR